MERVSRSPRFGGLYLSIPCATSDVLAAAEVTEAASVIGHVDTISSSTEVPGSLLADNVRWKAIRATLTQDFVPSAYAGKPALMIADSQAQAAAAMYALCRLRVGTIYTIGFAADGPFAPGARQLHSLDNLASAELPFVIISALPAGKSHIARPLLRHYSGRFRTTSTSSTKIVLDLRGSVAYAQLGKWISYGSDTINAVTISEAFKSLTKSNMSANFVQFAGGEALLS